MFSPSSHFHTTPALLCKAGGQALDYTDNIRTINGTPFFSRRRYGKQQCFKFTSSTYGI